MKNKIGETFYCDACKKVVSVFNRKRPGFDDLFSDLPVNIRNAIESGDMSICHDFSRKTGKIVVGHDSIVEGVQEPNCLSESEAV